MYLERQRAKQLKFPSPVWEDLQQTHANYNRLATPTSRVDCDLCTARISRIAALFMRGVLVTIQNLIPASLNLVHNKMVWSSVQDVFVRVETCIVNNKVNNMSIAALASHAVIIQPGQVLVAV